MSSEQVQASEVERDDVVVAIEPVKYYWRDWYTRLTSANGRVRHYGPWKTYWAAAQLARILFVRLGHQGQLSAGLDVPPAPDSPPNEADAQRARPSSQS